MTKEEIRNFSLRITQSTKTGLVVITYEIIINYINSAKECFENDDMEGLSQNIKLAKSFVDDLSSNLDFRYKISFNLMSLYMFINRNLLKANIRKNTELLDECIKIITSLKEAFSSIEAEDKRGGAMPNSEQVYAGLTYGKGSNLNEFYLR